MNYLQLLIHPPTPISAGGFVAIANALLGVSPFAFGDLRVALRPPGVAFGPPGFPPSSAFADFAFSSFFVLLTLTSPRC